MSLAVSSAGEPYDGGPGNSLRTRAAQEQLFQDVESWKPRLIVAYLSDWTPGASELALKLVRRQRAGDVRFSSGIHSTPRCHCPLVTSRRDSIWSTELWMVGLQTLLKRRHDLGGWSIGCVQQEANVSEALVSFLNLDGKSGDDMKSPSCVHVASRTSEPILTPTGTSFDDTKLKDESPPQPQTISSPDRRRTLR